MRSFWGILLIACGVSLWSGGARAKVVVVPISSKEVTAVYASEDSVHVLYVVAPRLPNELKVRRIDRATLECVLDVDAGSDYADGGVEIEVHPLTSDFTAGTPLEFLRSRAVRSVLVGPSRVVKLDITSVVRSWVADPVSYHGLVLGSLSGEKEGVFLLRNDRLGGGNVARILIRYGPRESTEKDIRP